MPFLKLWCGGSLCCTEAYYRTVCGGPALSPRDAPVPGNSSKWNPVLQDLTHRKDKLKDVLADWPPAARAVLHPMGHSLKALWDGIRPSSLKKPLPNSRDQTWVISGF